MHLLAREEVGLRCLLQVATRGRSQEAAALSIAAIAEAEGLSAEYAAKLLRQLRLGGLVKSQRGAAGGYRLSRSAAEITVWDAIQVLDDDFLPETSCDCQPDERRDCLRTTRCAIQTLWRGVGGQIRQALEAISLEDLCREEDRRAPTLLPTVTRTAGTGPVTERKERDTWPW